MKVQNTFMCAVKKAELATCASWSCCSRSHATGSTQALALPLLSWKVSDTFFLNYLSGLACKSAGASEWIRHFPFRIMLRPCHRAEFDVNSFGIAEHLLEAPAISCARIGRAVQLVRAVQPNRNLTKGRFRRAQNHHWTRTSLISVSPGRRQRNILKCLQASIRRLQHCRQTSPLK